MISPCEDGGRATRLQSPNSILDLLADALHDGTGIRFLPVDSERRSGSALWEASGDAASWLRARVGADASLAAVFETSFPCVATIIGAWRAGSRLASLPVRGRGVEITDYRETVRSLCSTLEASVILGSRETVASLRDLGVPAVSFDECMAGGPVAAPAGTPSFVQFSSGTTARPKGVELTLESIGTNVAETVSVLVHEDPVGCSWLPLSHDMGFIGMLLAQLVFGHPEYAGRSEVVLMTPAAFLGRPMTFLNACGELGVTITAMPNFGMDVLARRPPTRPVDLRRMQNCIVGAEPVRAATLRAFTSALSPHGLDPRAICPAYGLAEAVLAVCVVPPAEHWTSAVVSADALADGRWLQDGPGETVELVSVGPPLPSTEVQVVDGTEVGEILVRSSSLLSGYLGAETPIDDAGWLRTGDIGRVGENGTYIVGRTDDMLIVAGRKLYATQMESVLDGSRVTRPHAATVVPDGDGRYVVVAERRRGARMVSELPAAAGELRTDLARRFGVGPSAIVFLRPGGFPMTTSGKIPRNLIARRLAKGDLDIEVLREFGSGRSDP